MEFEDITEPGAAVKANAHRVVDKNGRFFGILFLSDAKQELIVDVEKDGGQKRLVRRFVPPSGRRR